MSKINIKGLVKNIKTRANVYTPVIEAIVNSIQAIEESERDNGRIIITLRREKQAQLQLDRYSLPEITSIEINDNGIGFNEINRNSFDTVYSGLKDIKGGKGYGRFMFLRYFNSVHVESVYKDNNNQYYQRKFVFGKQEEIIEDEKINAIAETDTSTTLFLHQIQDGKFDKKIETFARNILEKLLIYFVNQDYVCPQIIVKEGDEDVSIILNEYLADSKHAEIQKIAYQEFTLKNDNIIENFNVITFKLFFPNSQRSKIVLTAHNREVTETSLHNYIPEFEDDFYEESINEKGIPIKSNFIIKSYVTGEYLDSNVSLERGDFSFAAQKELLSLFSQEEIESKVAEITRTLFEEEVRTRKEKKLLKIHDYIKDSPWHREYINDLDVSSIPYNFTDEIIELELHKAKFKQERVVKSTVKKIIDNADIEIDDTVADLVNKISKAEMSSLAHYVVLRKTILMLFKKSLEINSKGKYSLESTVHNIIFPTRSDSSSTLYRNHNLWIIDEKLNFTEFVSSDQPLNGGVSDRADLLIFNRRMVFRGENQLSNPITIFEFKKPQRDDFVNASSKEDPVQQMIRYVNDIKDGKYKTPKGKTIYVGENTPFYGFVVCDLTKKVTDWLLREKDFKSMPDGQGWFNWFTNINLYIEVISWDKLLRDAEMRHKVFFHMLGVDSCEEESMDSVFA